MNFLQENWFILIVFAMFGLILLLAVPLCCLPFLVTFSVLATISAFLIMVRQHNIRKLKLKLKKSKQMDKNTIFIPLFEDYNEDEELGTDSESGLVSAISNPEKNHKKKKDSSGENNNNSGSSNPQQNIPKFIVNSALFNIPFADLKNWKEIGAGAASIVCKADWGGTTVAVKLLKSKHSAYTSDETAFKMFERELTVLSSIKHNNIVSFYGYCFSDARFGIVMEYCPQGTLRKMIDNLKDSANENNGLYFSNSSNQTFMKGNLFAKIDVLKQIVSGMCLLHSKGVIHRDLKADNILMNQQFIPKITDFGVSKLKEDLTKHMTLGNKFGTAQYLAPEVSSGLPYNEKCDIYSYGILMHEILFETTDPYPGESSPHILVAHDPKFRPKLPIFAMSRDEAFKRFIFQRNELEKFNYDFSENNPLANGLLKQRMAALEDLIELMKLCYEQEPDQRPSFGEIENGLSIILDKIKL